MDLNQLRYFREIARLGSMSAAARALKVSQPTLSVAMRQLEESLRSKLLLRHRGGVNLTAAGDELLVHAEEIFAAIDRAAAAVAGLERDLVGNYVLGCHESLGAYFLPRFLPGFLREAPQIALTLHSASSGDVLRAVVDREIPFGLVVNPASHPDLVLVRLFRDAVDLFVAAADDAPAPAGAAYYGPEGCYTADLAVAAALLRDRPLMFAGRVQQCAWLMDQLAERDVVPRRLLSCGDFELVKSLALAGVGAAILPRRIAAYGHEGRLRRLHHELPIYPDQICLIYRADLPKTRAAVFLKDALLRCGREMPDVGVPERQDMSKGTS
ncbi:MAG: LysR family transcriptional regulator [Myxococcales bacterium]|nr:LysR family transcriptional regulator [Myxococcales bacterium]